MSEDQNDQSPEETTTTTQAKDPRYPLKVEYCPVCTLPPEFCCYTDKFSKCKPWLLKNYPHLYPELQNEEGATEGAASEAAQESKPSEGKSKKQAEPPQVVIKVEQRQRKKFMTIVTGLSKFGIKLADASKIFSKKFACSASVQKGKDEICIQGDVQDDLVDFLLQTYSDKIKEDQIFLEEDGKKVPAK